MEITVTSTSCKVDAGLPSEVVCPHPDTVATWPVYRDWVKAGRQTGAMVEEKVRGKVNVRME